MELLNLGHKYSFVEKVRIALSFIKPQILLEFVKFSSKSIMHDSKNGRGNVQHRTGGVLSKSQHNDLVKKASKLRKKRNCK